MVRGKKYQAEQVVNLLRQIEVSVANGKSTEQACREASIVEQTYYRIRLINAPCSCSAISVALNL